MTTLPNLWQQRIKKALLPVLLLFLSALYHSTYAQDTHPHILVKPQDKEPILKKMNQQAWAKKIFDEMMHTVTPYVERHKTDPEWILSRYLMNRVPGKRYTQFFSDEDGTALLRYAGNAPYPTVRVSPHKRPPVTKDGYGYKMPTIEELVPYDTSMKMLLTSNAPGGKKEWVDPQSFVQGINGKINELALHASIIYWLTGKENYARFAADILTQWARGASYQNPIEGPCRTGFLSIQTLGDGVYEPMPLIYDFLYYFLREKKYETNWYEGVFQKIAHTMTFRGFWNNNWFAAQTPALVFAALSLENKQRREYYLDFVLNKDTISGSCGHLSMPSVVSKWLTPDGHWKEPGGYHNFPVSSLLIAGLAMDKNGYDVFQKNPALFQSSYVMLKYSFPNFNAPSIGDTGPVSQSPECLEIGVLMAKKYDSKMLEQLTSAMDVMIKQKGYKRENADYLGLLCYLPEIPSHNKVHYSWPRSGELDFAKCYLQRNRTDREHGLMYVVQGATYNHNHANGMSLELYGKGSVMGIDPGKGITYEAPMHVNYYAQWAAHNTVSAGGLSSSVPPFKGGGGTKNIGAIKLEAMEPLPEKDAVSPLCSFTDTRYTDISTRTNQQRTLAIIRTSPTAGYYVDIYRSAHPKSNEYVYHNIGNSIQFLSEDRKPIVVKPAPFPISKEPLDPPGFRLIQDYASTGKTDNNVIALFGLKERGDNRYMQVLFAGENDRVFYSGKAPHSGTADIPYRNLSTPTIISRQEGEAWKRPFIVIYEPFSSANNYTVEKIQNGDRTRSNNFTTVTVFNKDGSRQTILQSITPEMEEIEKGKFKGNFGVVGHSKKGLQYLYLGSGSYLSYQQYTLQTARADGAANLEMDGRNLRLTCNQETTIFINNISVRRITATEGESKKEIAFSNKEKGISFILPATKGTQIQIQ